MNIQPTSKLEAQVKAQLEVGIEQLAQGEGIVIETEEQLDTFFQEIMG
jgi:hypothetical protein